MRRVILVAAVTGLILIQACPGVGQSELPASARYRRHEIFALRPTATLPDTLNALSLLLYKTADVPKAPECCAVVGRIEGISPLTRQDLDADAWSPEVLGLFLEGDGAVLLTLRLEEASTKSPMFKLSPATTIRVPALFLDTPLAHWDNPARRRPEFRTGDRIACLLLSWPAYGSDIVVRTASVLLLPDSTSTLALGEAEEIERILSVYRRAALDGIGLEK